MVLMVQAILGSAQLETKDILQITPRVGYDFPSYHNNLKYVDYDGGLALGMSVDKYWKWYGLGVDFDYITNTPNNTYPTTDLYIEGISNVTPIPNADLIEDNISRMFAGIGPSLKYQSNNDRFVAEFTPRIGVANITGGHTQASIMIASTSYPISEHGGYDGSLVLSYKGQARFNYYLSENWGLHAGGYYLNHIDASEQAAQSGYIEQYYDVKQGNPNEILSLRHNIRTQACDCDLNSFGAFLGISFSPSLFSSGSKTKDPTECLTCPDYAIRINVEDQISGEKIYNATIELVPENGLKFVSESTDGGGSNFEQLLQDNYTAYATVEGEQTDTVSIAREELIFGGVVSKTVYLKKAEPEAVAKAQSVNIVVKDKPSGLLIPEADVIVSDEAGAILFTGKTNNLGVVNVPSLPAGNYVIRGNAFEVETSGERIAESEFEAGGPIMKELFYDDLRFVLKGKTIDTYTRLPKGDVNVSLKNDITKTVQQTTSSSVDGKFNYKLDVESSYTIQGQKRGEFSEIETVSTRGLIRDEVLFVEIELGIAKPTCDKLIGLKNIFFDLDKADIRPEAAAELDRVYTLLIENPNMSIELRSHTDSRGAASYNQKLSQRRANSTKNYLVNRGINPSRILATGYGESQLTNQCVDGVPCSDQEHQLNRRTEFKVVCQ